MQRIQQICFVDVGTLRLYKASIALVQRLRMKFLLTGSVSKWEIVGIWSPNVYL